MNELDDPKQYLLDYLREEFDRYPQVRLRIVPLTQDDGVSAKTETREYFFPTDWVRHRKWDQVRRLSEKIKDLFF